MILGLHGGGAHWALEAGYIRLDIIVLADSDTVSALLHVPAYVHKVSVLLATHSEHSHEAVDYFSVEEI